MSDVLSEANKAAKPIRDEMLRQETKAFGVHYGWQPIDDIDLSRFDGIVFERLQFPQPPEGMGDVDAIAYIPMSGFHVSNNTHTLWRERVDELNAWLLDENGEKLEDPSGPGTYLVDLRVAGVKELYHEIAFSHIEAGYDGVLLDAHDSVAWRESQNPESYEGLSQASGDIILSIATEFEGSGNRVIVNGGLFTAGGYDLLPLIAGHPLGIELMVESQFTDAAGTVRPPSVNNWSQARLNQYVQNSEDPTVHFVELRPLTGQAVFETRDEMIVWAKDLIGAANLTVYVEDGGNYSKGLVAQQEVIDSVDLPVELPPKYEKGRPF